MSESVDEIRDYLQARYLSAREDAWRIFGFRVNYRDPSVTPLPAHLPSRAFDIFQESNEQVAAATTVSKLQRSRESSGTTVSLYVHIQESYIPNVVLDMGIFGGEVYLLTLWEDNV